ncbi:MAG TPA: 2OG-Fe(II) oxygenase [Bryobacteraceae bacterium]|nr:2OG-Fe(II) oxygenase [Bryobacteraceae bacterium]
MPLEVLNPSSREQVESLRQQFSNAQPFRYVVIDGFLDPAFCAQLIADFPPFQKQYSVNERGETGRKAAVSELSDISPAYARFDALLKEPAFLSLVGRITGIPALLYDPEYLGGGTHENLDGQELDFHVDFNYHPSTRFHRRLNLIVYLNDRWEEEWGGSLELARHPWATGTEDVRTVLPLANRAVIFETTENSWHGFRRIALPADESVSRRSIAVYFYTKDRPANQAAPSHATVYYQRPLPAHIHAGTTLTEEDDLEIQTLLARRDKQIQFLYERELEFSNLISGITNSVSFRIGRGLTWPARAIRSLLATIRFT